MIDFSSFFSQDAANPAGAIGGFGDSFKMPELDPSLMKLNMATGPQSWGGKITDFFNNPGAMAVLANVGSALSGGSKTPMGQAGAAISGAGQSMAYNEAMKKNLASALGGMGFRSSPTLSSADVVGLTPDQVKSLYGTALDFSKFGGEMFKTVSDVAAKAESRPSEIAARQAYADYMTEMAASAAETSRLKTKEEADWKLTLENFESGKIPMPKWLDQQTMALLKGMTADDAKPIVKELLREQALGIKIGHAVDDENIVTFNASPQIATIPDPDRPGQMKEVYPGGIINKIHVTKRKGSQLTPEQKVGFQKMALDEAIADFFKELQDDYLKTVLPTADKQRAAAQFRQMYATIDPRGVATGKEIAFGYASPELKSKIRARAAEHLRRYAESGVTSQGPVTNAPAASTTGKTAESVRPTSFDVANRESQAQWLNTHLAEIQGKLNGKVAGQYTVQTKGGGKVVVSWDGKGGVDLAVR